MKPGDELRNPVTGQRIRCLEHTPEVLVLESFYRAGGRPAPAHLHPSQEERFEVLEGSVRCLMAGRRQTLHRGEIVVVEPGVAHDFGGDPELDGRVRWETRPALRTAELLETNFTLAQEGRVSGRTGMPGLLQLAVTLSEYDEVFRLSRPARPVQRVVFALLATIGRARGLEPRHP